MTTFHIGDARPDFNFTVKSKGSALNLTGSTATTRIRKKPNPGEIVSSNHLERAATAIDLANGRYDHTWLTDGSDFEDGDEGRYFAWLDIILSDGDPLQTSKYNFNVVKKHE